VMTAVCPTSFAGFLPESSRRKDDVHREACWARGSGQTSTWLMLL